MWLVAVIPALVAGAAWTTATIGTRFLVQERLLGASGYLARKSDHLGPELLERILDQVVTIPELFEFIGRNDLVRHLVDSTQPRVGMLLEQIMLDQDVILWESVPASSRRRIVTKLKESIPDIADSFFDDLGDNIAELLDMEHLVQTTLVHDRGALGRIVDAAAGTDLAYFRSLAVRLALLGSVIPVAVALLGGNGLIEAVAAAVVVATACRLALYLVFRPLNPVIVGGVAVQGSLLRRQPEVAQTATRQVLVDVASVPNLARSLFEGDAGSRTRALAVSHAEPLTREAMRPARRIVIRHLGPEGYERLVDSLSRRVVQVALDQYNDPAFAFERQIAVERVMVARVRAMTPKEFETLLRPLIRDIESLILPGGALAGAAAAVVFVLAHHLVG